MEKEEREKAKGGKGTERKDKEKKTKKEDKNMEPKRNIVTKSKRIRKGKPKQARKIKGGK